MQRKCILSKPEEIVRQKLLSDMTNRLGYPSSLLSVEKELSHFYQKRPLIVSPPKRRVDVLCFTPVEDSKQSVCPLLLIECKAVALTKKAIRQVEGYNYFIGAFFWALCNSSEFFLFWIDSITKKRMSLDFLPSYKTLVQAV